MARDRTTTRDCAGIVPWRAARRPTASSARGGGGGGSSREDGDASTSLLPNPNKLTVCMLPRGAVPDSVLLERLARDAFKISRALFPMCVSNDAPPMAIKTSVEMC